MSNYIKKSEPLAFWPITDIEWSMWLDSIENELNIALEDEDDKSTTIYTERQQEITENNCDSQFWNGFGMSELETGAVSSW
tara:strand:+ start:376 stop:618 length:243 start_codon:yes stop_codon:yes gene_type:complete